MKSLILYIVTEIQGQESYVICAEAEIETMKVTRIPVRWAFLHTKSVFLKSKMDQLTYWLCTFELQKVTSNTVLRQVHSRITAAKKLLLKQKILEHKFS